MRLWNIIRLYLCGVNLQEFRFSCIFLNGRRPPLPKKRTKRKLDLPTWLAGQIKAAGVTQFQISEEIGVNANDLSRWKNGQAVPEMDNLLRLAHYFNEDPEKLFEMAGKPELIAVYRLFLPKYQERQLTEEDLYKNRKHAELHRRMERLLVHGCGDIFEAHIGNLEEEYYLLHRLEELVRLTHASGGALIAHEKTFKVGGETHDEIKVFARGAFEDVLPKYEWVDNPPKGTTIFTKEKRQGNVGAEIHLFLKNPKMQPFIEKLIDVYFEDWLKGAWPDASHEES